MWREKRKQKQKIEFVTSSHRMPPSPLHTSVPVRLRSRHSSGKMISFFRLIFWTRFSFSLLLFAIAVNLTTKCTRSNKISCVFSVVPCDPVSSFSLNINHGLWLMARNYIFGDTFFVCRIFASHPFFVIVSCQSRRYSINSKLLATLGVPNTLSGRFDRDSVLVWSKWCAAKAHEGGLGWDLCSKRRGE